MTREEIFKILDAMQLSVEDVNAYLDALCGKTPLKLAYETDGSQLFTHNVLPKGKFLGIVINDILYYAKGFTRQDLFDGNNQKIYDDLSVQDVLDWMKKHIGVPFSPQVHPMTDNERYRLEEHKKEFDETLLILKRHGFTMPNGSTLAVLEDSPQSVFCDFFDGHARLEHFLGYADFWFCAPK